jgi:hypothetical protein
MPAAGAHDRSGVDCGAAGGRGDALRVQSASLRCTCIAVSVKPRRSPPYLIVGLALSLLFHGAMAMLSLLPALARRLLPRLPIEMTILPPKPPPRPSSPPPVAKPPPPAPPPAAKTGEGGRKPAPRKPAARPTPATPQQPKITSLAGLGPSAIDRDVGVRVILRMASLRTSPHRPALLSLLTAFPDMHILAHGTGRPAAALAALLVDELQVLLIATPDPSNITATAFYGIYEDRQDRGDRATLRGVLGQRQRLDWDPRELSAPARGLLAFARPDLLGPGTYTPPPPAGAPPDRPESPTAPPPSPPADWAAQLRSALLVPGPALSAEILNVHERIRLGGGLPTPTALRLAMSGEERPSVVLRAELRTPGEAAQLAALVPELKAKLSPYLFLFGLSGLLDDLKLETRGAAVELAGPVPGRQLDVLLGLLAQQLPPPTRFVPPPPPPPLPAPPVPPDAAGDAGADGGS